MGVETELGGKKDPQTWLAVLAGGGSSVDRKPEIGVWWWCDGVGCYCRTLGPLLGTLFSQISSKKDIFRSVLLGSTRKESI